MILAKLVVDGISIRPKMLNTIPEGIIGATIEINYSSPEWQHLKKTVVFQGCVTKDVLDAGTTVEIPAEVVAEPGWRLAVGVYGMDAENKIVIPTLWCDLGPVAEAADPSGDESTDPQLPVWAQLQEELEQIKKLGGAINGIPAGGKAGQYLCKKSDEDYDVAWSDLVIPEQYGLVTYTQDKTISIT